MSSFGVFNFFLSFKNLNYKMIQNLMCVLIVKSVFLDLSRFLWNHYVICDWEEWVSVTFPHQQLWKYTSSPSSLIKGLSEFLFGCLSTMCSSPFDTFSKNIQGHFVTFLVVQLRKLGSDCQVWEAFSNLKPIAFYFLNLIQSLIM